MTDSPTEAELLETLRRMVGESSVRQVAKRMKIAHTTLGELLDPESTRRPYGPTLEKIAAYVRKSGYPVTTRGERVVRESAERYGTLPDRLAITIGALEVIRDAADAALRRVGAMAGDGGLPGQGGVAEGPPRRAG